MSFVDPIPLDNIPNREFRSYSLDLSTLFSSNLPETKIMLWNSKRLECWIPQIYDV